MKVLMVLTSHEKLGDTSKPTGFWLEEFTAPYYTFVDAGAEVILASPRGGMPPIDPMSEQDLEQNEHNRRYLTDGKLRAKLNDTVKLGEIDGSRFDALFFPGGHGPLWDLAEDPDCRRLLETFYAEGKPVAAVCHGPAVFKDAKLHSGEPLVAGRRVTGFSNSEEAAVELTDVVPFLVETMLVENGGRYEKAEDWQSHVVVDGHLITGQNPASSGEAASAMLELVGKER